VFINIPADLPSRTAFDIEIARDIPRKGDGRLNWDAVKKGKSGISCLAAWRTCDLFPLIAILDNTRFPRTLAAELWLASLVAETDGVVTWNGAGFDLPVVRSATPKLFEAMDGRMCVVLLAIMALLKTGVDPEKLVAGVPEDWITMAPRIGRNAHAWINEGFSLDSVSKATLGEHIGKMAGFDGGQAIDSWQAGHYSKVSSYCIGDTALTLALYIFAWINGYLVSPSQGRVNIPREVL
jgi:hypothetical protein